MRFILCLIYGDSPAELQSWEKLQRNAEIYRRYLSGEDSVALGRAYGLSDRRIRDIIEHERKRRGQ
jgi:Mor family transcriptional regulator